jgi:hypothetical protein
MDREFARRHLAETEATIANGLQHIIKQRLKIEHLMGGGHDTAHAEDLLLIFLDLQRGHEEFREWLQGQLAKTPAPIARLLPMTASLPNSDTR